MHASILMSLWEFSRSRKEEVRSREHAKQGQRGESRLCLGTERHLVWLELRNRE
jgi:hypothetical protein